MPRRYRETNTFLPAAVTQDLQATVAPPTITVSEAQYAQERFLSQALSQANPPFALTKSTNRLVNNGSSIMRGFIRRADIDVSDPTSAYRLYFMYNPSTIQRNYIAYLDQQALDPGNAMFGSNNMAAAPGLLDFNFELLFDRQLEVATDATNVGTKVDYDYFDLVVRGVIPDADTTGNSIPDNGIIMVNPNNIMVVFGEDLTVQGKPYNANIVFEKFSHRMVPTRLRINLAMKAMYIGPRRSPVLPNVNPDLGNYTATIPYDESVKYKAQSEKVTYAKLSLEADSTNTSFSNAATTTSTSTTGSSTPPPAGNTTGRVLTISETAAYARQEGFSGENLITAIAIAMGESGLRTDAVGDAGITDSVWGPSIGLMQIRSLNAQKGTGDPRDELANYDPGHNLWAAWLISSEGSNFTPWSVYTSGKYLQFMDQVRSEVGTLV